MLTHTKDPIAEPLTTLPTKELEAEALKLFKVGTSLDILFALENIRKVKIENRNEKRGERIKYRSASCVAVFH